MMERALFGPPRERFADMTDASLVEAIPLVILAVSIVGVGVYPFFLTEVFNLGLEPMVEILNEVLAPNASGLAGTNP